MVCLNACKKKEEPAPVPRAQLLAGTSSKTWKITAATTTGQPAANFLLSFDECQKDNLFILHTDKKLVLDEGATKCNSSNPQTISTGTWSLSADEKKITLSTSGSIVNGDVNITELSNTTLKGTFTYLGTPVNVTFTAQ